MTTGYLWDEIFGWHDTGTGTLLPADPDLGHQPIPHPLGHPDTKRRMHELICVSGLIDHLVRITPRAATVEELARVHTPGYIDRIVRESGHPKGGDAGDGISPFGKGGYRIAALAAGSAIAMTEAVLTGDVGNGYALINPPGHHAMPDAGMGYTVFNNVAIAARYAQAAGGVERIAIVDWDVHHGNGTQALFYDDPSVLTISIHQDRCYPADSGMVSERGTGAGENANINIPMPVGSGDGAYQYAARNVIGPALEAFAPDLILVASGFDPNGLDPEGRQLVSTRGFITLTETVMEAADRSACGRLVLVQEGGYSPAYVPFCGLATIETLAGVHVLDDGYLAMISGMGGHDLEPHQKERVDEVAHLVADVPRPKD